MQTSRLELVRLTKSHVAGYHAIWSDPLATRWSTHGPCEDINASERWMSELLLDANPLGENYAVLLRSDIDQLDHPCHKSAWENGDEAVLKPGGFLGWVGTWKSEPTPEVGFIFHRSAWGFGFATEALEAFLGIFWRSKPQFGILEAYCDTENAASIHVLEKCGFKLMERIDGDYVLPWMEPSIRNVLRFRATRCA
ncbi:hypothetical protein POX_f07453 [Penicillium oxalicum]|uniref:N-acetyltransferase domain-containing protein n=1 Tax=Penicillium oxalicum (strain 114-2 / CGMCC 5302) TaxID=933388 RepID=S7ZI63_PENO1|nr:hypothetical protein POX_f07453 [Penicillium oxalicum]EPS28366.1 hypothetical protein PDE_03312 [Penicillium oxalicum 114-2]KAI2787095.1 hypothetical protein POX_f07453 [Penicillium oxalicum]